MPTVPAVAIQRANHVVVAGGEPIARVGIEIDTSLYGEPEVERSTIDSILGEQDSWITMNWNAKVSRQQPHVDDDFPIGMPETICNLGMRVVEDDDDEPEAIYMNHLYVQEEARGRGYGLLMWDCYLAVVAYAHYELPQPVAASGGIGSTEGGATYDFLVRQGVPEADIIPGTKTPKEGIGTVTWETPAENVIDPAPITREEVDE